jgi:hypothetical protein
VINLGGPSAPRRFLESELFTDNAKAIPKARKHESTKTRNKIRSLIASIVFSCGLCLFGKSRFAGLRGRFATLANLTGRRRGAFLQVIRHAATHEPPRGLISLAYLDILLLLL